MATYIQQVQRIVDDLNRNDSSLTAVVQSHMQDAITYYETMRFWFNEGRTSFSTSSSLAYYALPTDLIEVDAMNVTINGRRVQLDPVTFNEIDRMDIGGYTGYPIIYAEHAEQFRLYPIPNGAYSVDLFYLKRLTTLTATSDTNAWTNQAAALIRARTMKTLFAYKFKDTEMAQVMQVAEDQELASLETRTEKVTSSGYIKGSDW